MTALDQIRSDFGPLGWRIFATDQGSLFAQRRYHWHGNELYQDAGPGSESEIRDKMIALERGDRP